MNQVIDYFAEASADVDHELMKWTCRSRAITSAFLIAFADLAQNAAVGYDEDTERESVHHDHSEGGVNDLVHPWREEVESNTLLVPTVLRVRFNVENKHLDVAGWAG